MQVQERILENTELRLHFEKLTPREVCILKHLADGKTYKEIADHCGISVDTVRMHLKHIYKKLNASNNAEAVAKGIRNGLIQ